MAGRSIGVGSRIFGTETAALGAVAALSLAVYAFIFLPFLPNSDNAGGSDYSYFLPQLLAGYYWFLHNGPFSVPWFTPAFCAGVPYHGNMQGMYFSLPQFLTFAVGPTKALQITFLTFAATGMGGFYALCRKAFGIRRWIALAGAVLFMFNGFFASRMLIGHLTFHAFMLVPLLALCVLAVRQTEVGRSWLDPWILLGALILAYMVQTGMVHALLPSLLGIVALILIHGYQGVLHVYPFVRLGVVGMIALAISAAKLVAGVAFLSNFPRTMIPLSGFGSIWQSLVVGLQSLFLSPPLARGMAWLLNNEWYTGIRIYPAYHEFEYGVSYIPAVIILAWLIAYPIVRLRNRDAAAPDRTRLVIVVLLGLLFLLPVLLNWYESSWSAFLKSLPLFGSSSTMLRWYCFYIPLLILIGMLIVDRNEGFRFAPRHIALAIVVTVILCNLGANRRYYAVRDDYNFTAVETAYRVARQSGTVPMVGGVVWPWAAGLTLMTRRDRDNALVRGGTNAQCYEPMFGHRMEAYPYTALRKGPTLRARNGMLNIKNPACMQYPEANQCKPGDHFQSSDLGAARAFVNYRPFPFEFPWWQTLANRISLISFLMVLAGLAATGVRRLRVPWRRLAVRQA